MRLSADCLLSTEDLSFQRVFRASMLLRPPAGDKGNKQAGDNNRSGHLYGGDPGDVRQRRIGEGHRGGDCHGVSGSGGHSPARISGAPGDQAVTQNDEPAADENREEAQEDAGDAASRHVHKIDARAQGESDQRDDPISHRSEEVPHILIQITHQHPQGHGDDGRHKRHHRDAGKAGGAQSQQGEKGAVVQGQQGKAAAVGLVTVVVDQGQVDGAVGVGHGRDDGKRREAEKTLGAEELPHGNAKGRANEKLG